MQSADLERVRAVLDRYRDEIQTRYRAVGTGIGKRSREDPTYVIVVYLESERDRPSGSAFIEGISLKFEVTGRFRTLDESR